MNTTVVCERNPALPCDHSWKTYSYTFCYSCVQAQEVRFCDGSTKPSWNMCQRHQEMVDNNEIQVKDEMLQFLRESVYDGSIPRPEPELEELPPTPPTSSQTTAPGGISSNQTSGPLTDWIDVEISLPCEPPAQPRQRVPFRRKAIYPLWPEPVVSCSHVESCFYNPDVKHSTKPNGHNPPTMKVITTTTGEYKLATYHRKRLADMLFDVYDTVSTYGSYGLDVWIQDQIKRLSKDLLLLSERSRPSHTWVFHRRCNGMYVNQLGWGWFDEYASPDIRQQPIPAKDAHKFICPPIPGPHPTTDLTCINPDTDEVEPCMSLQMMLAREEIMKNSGEDHTSLASVCHTFIERALARAATAAEKAPGEHQSSDDTAVASEACEKEKEKEVIRTVKKDDKTDHEAKTQPDNRDEDDDDIELVNMDQNPFTNSPNQSNKSSWEDIGLPSRS